MSDRTNDEDREERRPYEAPAIEETASFETLALACANPDPYTGEFS